jgi:DNA topoisomerase-3
MRAWVGRTETERFSPEQNLQPLIDEQRNHPAWGAYAASLLDDGKYQFPRMGEKDDQVRRPIQSISR